MTAIPNTETEIDYPREPGAVFDPDLRHRLEVLAGTAEPSFWEKRFADTEAAPTRGEAQQSLVGGMFRDAVRSTIGTGTGLVNASADYAAGTLDGESDEESTLAKYTKYVPSVWLGRAARGKMLELLSPSDREAIAKNIRGAAFTYQYIVEQGLNQRLGDPVAPTSATGTFFRELASQAPPTVGGVVVGVATKSPTLAAAMMAASETPSIYMDARGAGASPDDAMAAATLYGVASTYLEKAGLEGIMRNSLVKGRMQQAAGEVVKKGLVGKVADATGKTRLRRAGSAAIGEGITEGAQEVLGMVLSDAAAGKIPMVDVQRVRESMAFGAIIGGPLGLVAGRSGEVSNQPDRTVRYEGNAEQNGEDARASVAVGASLGVSGEATGQADAEQNPPSPSVRGAQVDTRGNNAHNGSAADDQGGGETNNPGSNVLTGHVDLLSQVESAVRAGLPLRAEEIQRTFGLEKTQAQSIASRVQDLLISGRPEVTDEPTHGRRPESPGDGGEQSQGTAHGGVGAGRFRGVPGERSDARRERVSAERGRSPTAAGGVQEAGGPGGVAPRVAAADQSLVDAARLLVDTAEGAPAAGTTDEGVRARLVGAPADVGPLIDARARRAGIRVVWVDAGPTAQPGVSGEAGVIALNATSGKQDKIDGYFWHEAVHDVDRRTRTGNGDPGTLWQDLRDTLADIAPDQLAQAEDQYARAHARAHARASARAGNPISDRLRQLEGPSQLAENVIETIRLADSNPAAFARLVTARPRFRDALIRKLDALLRALGMPGLRVAMGRIEQASQRKKTAMAANAIREAVRQLERVPGSPFLNTPISRTTSTATNTPTTPVRPSSEAANASPETTTGAPTASDSAGFEVQAGRRADLSIRGLWRRLDQVARDTGWQSLEDQSEHRAIVLAAESEAGGANSALEQDKYLVFPDKIPTEIKEALEGRPRLMRALRVAEPGERANGPDTFGQLGSDGFIAYLESITDTRIGDRRSAYEWVSVLPPEAHPEAEFLTTVLEMLDTTERRDDVTRSHYTKEHKETLVNPGALPDGAVFTMMHEKYVVVTDPDGLKAAQALVGSGGFNLDGVDEVPVETGSVDPEAGAVPEFEDSSLDDPFFAQRPRDADDPRGIFDQRTFDASTGSQQRLGFTEPSREDQVFEDRQKADEKRVGDDPGQAALFAQRPDGAITPFDTPGVVEARAKANAIGSTWKINTHARMRLRRRVARKLYATRPVETVSESGEAAIEWQPFTATRGRKAWLVLGPPAAGKSSKVANIVAERTGSLIVDSDMAKEELPEFDSGIGAGALHVESDAIASDIMLRAIKNGENMVLPRVGKGMDSMRSVRDALIGAGYEVHLLSLRLSPEKAAQRAVERFEKTGRFVDPNYVLNVVGSKPDEVYNKLKQEGGFATYAAYSNDVERGQQPQIIERSEGSIRIPSQGEPGLGQGAGPRRSDPNRRSPDGQEPPGRPDQADAESGDVDGPLFATQPEPDLFDPSGGTGTTTIGRPDLANPATTPESRALINEIDEARNRLGLPSKRADEQVEADVDRLLSDKPGSVRRSLMRKARAGETLDDTETAALRRITADEAIRAVASGSESAMATAVEMAHQWRELGTRQARAFRQRRDLVARPELRVREAFAQAITTPPERIRNRIDQLEKKIDAQATTEAEKDSLRDQLLTIWRGEGGRTAKIRRRLMQEGIDPRMVTSDVIMDPRTATRIARTIQGAKASTFDKVYEFWINSILSGPLTQAANIIGNTGNLIRLTTVQPLVSASINLVAHDPNSPTFREIAYTHAKMIDSIGSAFENMLSSWSTEAPVFTQKIEEAGGLTAQLALFELDKIGGTFPGAISGTKGRVVRVPGRALRAADEFFKTVMGTQTALAESYRIAKNEGLEGDAAVARIDDLMNDLTSDVWSVGIEKALEATFQTQNHNRLEKAVISVRGLELLNTGIRPMAFFIPFITTPMRIAGQGLMLTPIGQGYHLALKTVPRALNGSYKDNRSKLVSDLTTHLMGVGAMALLMSLTELDDEGFPKITGAAPMDKGERDLAYRTAPPQSIRVGGRWYSYSRIEPFATAMALNVDLINSMRRGDKFAGAGEVLPSISRSLSDKTFLRGLGDVFELVTDPNQRGDRAIQVAFIDPVLGFVPNIIKQPLRESDSVLRESKVAGGLADTGWWTAKAYRALPANFFPTAPPPKVDVWGRDIHREGPTGGTSGLSLAWKLGVPIRSQDDQASPVDVLLRNYHRKLEDGTLGPEAEVQLPRAPSNTFPRGGERIELSTAEYHRLMKSAGQKAHERLLGMVESGALNVDDPSEGDVSRIKSIYSRSLSRERDAIVRERGDR